MSFICSSSEVYAAQAQFVRCISTEFVDFEYLSTYTNYLLLALDKRPGVRPIVVGEVCRIVGKAILEVVKSDVRRVTGPTLLCAGQEGGCEAAVHATRMLFSD